MSLHLGIALVAMATLMLEILLVRIFSVTTWYHYAFASVALAMSGATLGAAAVFLLKGRFPAEKSRDRMASFSLLFGLSILGAYAASLALPPPGGAGDGGPGGLLPLLALFAVNGVPFVLGGVVLCLGLTRFPAASNTLYAADLAGAAAGCLAAVGLLSVVSGPTAVALVAALAAAAAAVLAGPWRWALPAASLAAAAGMAGFALHNERVLLASPGRAPLSPRTVKGTREPDLRYERWNAHSRVTVIGDEWTETEPFGWGLPAATRRAHRVRQLWIFIDAHAGTPLTGYDGDPSTLSFLRDDIVNLPHHLRRRARVMVVGAGGGRDLLAAVAFDQPSVVGVEVNGAIVEALRGPYARFTGNLEGIPGVSLVRAEARSFLAGSPQRYDIIQLSLVDTWAATAAGAFILTENSLYTLEAWGLFLDRLTDRGLLSSTRWWPEGRPAEVHRSVSLAAEALRRRGAADPRNHIAVVRSAPPGEGGAGESVGTLIVGRKPLSPADVAALEDACARGGFTLAAAPGRPGDAVIAALSAPERPDALLDEYPLRIDPPTDDAPYFFQMLRMRDFADPARAAAGRSAPPLGAVATLVRLLLLAAALAAASLLLPLLGRRPRSAWPAPGPPLAACFAALGLGFMLVEVSLLQRLTVHLGHPVYGLSVLLFSLLLGAGFGSARSGRLAGRGEAGTLLAVAAAVGILGFGVAALLSRLEGTPFLLRAGVAVLGVGSMGGAMGLAFPLAMAAALRAEPDLAPWLWGVNGAFSVLGSVLGVVMAIAAGIGTVLAAGVACYLAAAAAMALFARWREGGA